MSVITKTSNHFKYQLSTEMLDLSTDTLKAILMNTSFSFDPAVHDIISNSEIVTNRIADGTGGYTTLTLANVSAVQDNVNDLVSVTWDEIQWFGDGAGFGPVGSCIIFDDTSADDTVIGCITFIDPTSYTVGDDEIFRLLNTSLEVT